jgi:hypothetical protein
MNAGKLGDMMSGSTELRDMAKRLGMTPEQLAKAMGNADLIVMGPPRDGYAPNITALVVPVAELPDNAALKTGLGRAATDGVVKITRGRWADGRWAAAAVSLRVGTRDVASESVFFETSDGVVVDVAVSTLSRADTARLAKVLRATAHAG